VILGLGVGLGGAELAFHYRDHGAFPHLNLYRPDPELGVRLRPGETERVSFGGNPPTSIRINGEGFRGPELPAPGGDEVLIVGDSQVFGLGVEENETFSSRLEAMLGGARVVNAGVPTYGPLEYERVIAEQLARRKPKKVVYVVNFANDLFEAERPNTARHAVWDGWAVRKETAPVHVAWFPFRDFLFRKSHAVFALRRAIYQRNAPSEVQSLPSEGTWKDIAAAAARAAAEREEVQVDTRRLQEMHQAHLRMATDAAREARVREDELVARYLNHGVPSVEDELGIALRASHAEPGDIVGVAGLNDGGGEFSREVYATVSMILEGAKVRKRIEQSLREKARANERIAADVTRVLDGAEGAARRVKEVQEESLPELHAWSSLAPSLRRTRALCDAAGARLHVVALPLDVQVSADEWKKYAREPVDLAPSRVLIEDLLDTSRALGVSAIDLTASLRAAEPGAFLDHDLHMSPKGHAAVAVALAGALSSPAPVPPPRAGIPRGRTFPVRLTPLLWPWDKWDWEGNSGQRVFPLSVELLPSETGCDTYVSSEWLTIKCGHRGADKADPIGVRVEASPLGESVVFRPDPALAIHHSMPYGVTLTYHPGVVVMVPLLAGQTTVVDLRWPGRSRRLQFTWQEGALPHAEITPLPAGAPPIPELGPDPAWTGECEKEAKVSGVAFLPDNPACTGPYRADCAQRIACLRGDPKAPPVCPEGSAPVGVFQRCRPLCAADRPCAAGACVAYEGGSVCL
jgi:hypothetical protein